MYLQTVKVEDVKSGDTVCIDGEQYFVNMAHQPTPYHIDLHVGLIGNLGKEYFPCHLFSVGEEIVRVVKN